MRGVFSFKNIQVFFDNISDFLTVVVNGFKVITDIKDDQKRAHWCFTFVKNDRFTVYKNAKEVYSLAAGDKPVDMADGFIIGGGRTHATFDEVRVYKTVLKQGEINGLFHLVSKGTQVKQVEKLVQGVTPKYLGVVETVPTTRTAIITKGPRLGAQDANGGDWVLMGKTVGGWKCGVCYRWTGGMWINLEPEYKYTEQYQAALYHICEIEELMKNTGHFGALFAKVLVAQQAFIDKLVAQEAFIDKLVVQEAFINQLAANQAFLKQLIVQRLQIDSDDTTHQDFEAWFDKTNGLKINNKGEEIFKVDTTGNVFAKNASFMDSSFSGKIKPSKGLLNSWYWSVMREEQQSKWFEVFDKRMDIGERLSCFGGGVFFNQNESQWRTVIISFIERISENQFELNGFPLEETTYPAICQFNKENTSVFSRRFYIGW